MNRSKFSEIEKCRLFCDNFQKEEKLRKLKTFLVSLLNFTYYDPILLIFPQNYRVKCGDFQMRQTLRKIPQLGLDTIKKRYQSGNFWYFSFRLLFFHLKLWDSFYVNRPFHRIKYHYVTGMNEDKILSFSFFWFSVCWPLFSNRFRHLVRKF